MKKIMFNISIIFIKESLLNFLMLKKIFENKKSMAKVSVIFLSIIALVLAVMFIGGVSGVSGGGGVDPVCGNDIIEGDEQCDDGDANQPEGTMDPVWNLVEGVGDRNYCSDECIVYEVLGTWCGDQTVQASYEDCDDGNTDNGDGCDEICEWECVPGATQSCGTDVGECEYGTETCSEGLWGDCEGGITPQPEVCDNGLDDDCDGPVDCEDNACEAQICGVDDSCKGICMNNACSSDGKVVEGSYCDLFDCPDGCDGVPDAFYFTYDYAQDLPMFCDEVGVCNGATFDQCDYDHYCCDNDMTDGAPHIPETDQIAPDRCDALCDQESDCPDQCVSPEIYQDRWCGLEGSPPSCECEVSQETNCDDRDVYICADPEVYTFRDYSCSLDPAPCDYTDTVVEDCDGSDGWYDTVNTRWVNTDDCNEKEEQEQEYREYYCVAGDLGGCDFRVTDTRWVDTDPLNTRYEAQGTECGDEVCNSCDASGSCIDETGEDGTNCDEDCSECVVGSCDSRSTDDNTEVTQDCYYCDGTNSASQPYTGDTGLNCDDDCDSCVYGDCLPRNTCDGTECTGQELCNDLGDCADPDEDLTVCGCYQAVFGDFFFDPGLYPQCCDDDIGENYITTEPNSACCDVATDCVDEQGICQDGTEGDGDCADGLDNDCDGLIDCADPDCDTTPPVTTKTYIPDAYEKDGIKYIDTINRVELTAEDLVGVEELCASGVAVKQYRVSVSLADKFCYECENWMGLFRPDIGPWNDYIEPFAILDESCHVIEYRSIDNLRNEEEIQWQCVFVDKTKPVTTKWYEGPQYNGGLPEYSFQTFSQDIEGSDYDLEVTIEDDGTWIIWTFDFPVETFTGDGNLNVGLIIATDGEGNGPAFQIHNNDGADSGHDWGTWLMSPWGPTIGDGWNGWHSGDTNTPVTSLSWVEATGNRNVPHGDGILQVKILKSELGESFHWAASPTVGSGFYAPVYDVSMQIPTAFGWSTPLVDMTVPNYEYAESVKGEYPKWITSETEIYLSATDNIGPHDSGVKATYWRNTLLVDDESCWNQELCQQAEGSGDWNLYEGYFQKGEESCHLIEYYSIDNVDKTETVNKQCVFVDNTPPTPIKEVGEPKTEWDGLDANFYDLEEFCEIEDNCWKVTLDTEIDMSCLDEGDHPVNHERICFNVELDGDDWTEDYCEEDAYNGDMIDGYCCLDKTITDFTFLESSEHNLKFYCVDALGNTNLQTHDEKFKVEGNDFEIELNKKWNLISVPVVLLNDDPAEVFENMSCVDSIWTYNGKKDKWYVFTPDEAPDNLKIEPGFGYWIMAKEDCILTIGGSLLSPGRTPPSRDLVPGWNLIGYYGMSDQKGYHGPAENGDEAYCSLYSLVNTNSFIPAKRWSSLYGYWESEFDGYGMCDNLDPGAGYWIHMPADMEQYSYAPSTGCPTAFWDLICSPFS